MPAKAIRLSVAGILLVHAGLLAHSAAVHSPTWDEPMHLAGGLRHWQFGSFDLDRGNGPLVPSVAALPVLLARPATDWSYAPNSHVVGNNFAQANGPRIFWLVTLGRWACIVFSLLGGIVCFRWSAELFGTRAGFAALLLWCCAPNVLGHGGLITGDIPATAIGLGASYLFRRWLHRATLSAAAFAGCALAAAEVTKYLWVILYALWPLLWMIWRGARTDKAAARPRFWQLILILALAVYGTNFAYLFNGSFKPAREYPFISRLFKAAASAKEDRGSIPRWLAGMPIPLPVDYVRGADEVTNFFEFQHRCYLRGAWHEGGWWYYYLYGLLIKVPLGTWCMLGLAALAAARGFGGRIGWRECMLLVVPPAVILTFVTSLSGCNHHLRYAFPVLPYVFILASRSFAGSWGAAPKFSMLACGAFVWSVASGLAYFPHNISYFNELTGGPGRGHEQFVDSNFDWGQDLLYLKKWYDAHPEARPLQVAYFGPVNPKAAGIDFVAPPKGVSALDHAPAGPQPGWFAVSASWAHGYRWLLPQSNGTFEMLDEPVYDYFLRFRPQWTAGYSILIYHVSVEEANAVRAEMGLPMLSPKHRQQP